MAISGHGQKGRSVRGRGTRLALSLTAVSLLAVLAALTGDGALGVAMLVLGPLLACSWLDARRTAVTVGWALLLVVPASARARSVTTAHFAAEFLVLLVSGVLTVRIAARHSARGAALDRVTEVARAAQGAILRPVSAEIGGIEVCTRHHCPARESSVCGDVYDVVHTPYGTRVLIGDVRGHDLGALPVAAAVVAAFRDLAYVTPGLPELARGLDARLTPELGQEDFVTVLLAEFVPGEVRLVNCGHPAPLRVGQQIKLLEPGAPTLPLGLCPTPTMHRVWLQPGDRLLLYTDGLSEARDASGADFPLLERVGAALAEPLPSDALDALYASVTAHTGAPLADDLALVLCQPTDALETGYSAGTAPGGTAVPAAPSVDDASRARGHLARES